jgi:uncharacterized protein YegP (UPF0339 family)
MGKFVITQRANSAYQFNLKASNGRVISKSEFYESEAARENGIASVMKNSIDAIVEEE